jgi:hypothetical protein
MWNRRKKNHGAAGGDQLLLRQLEKLGADLSLPRSTRHYLYFPAESDATQAAQLLEGEGYAIEQRPGADGANWLMLASRTEVVDAASVAQFRSRLTDMASSLGGEYDGWEAAPKP